MIVINELEESMSKETIKCKLCGKIRVNVGFGICQECADKNKEGQDDKS